MAKINLKKPVRDVLLGMEKDYPKIKEFIKGFDFYCSNIIFKDNKLHLNYKNDLKLLARARKVSKKEYEPISYSRDYWLGIALAQVIYVLSKYLSDSKITWRRKRWLSFRLLTTATLIGRAMKRFEWGKKTVKMIRVELIAVIKQKKLEKREELLMLLFEKSFAK